MDNENDILHIGVKYRSGRYPWGSGENPYQHDEDFMARYNEQKAAGLSDTEIAQAMKLPTEYMRQRREIINNKLRQEEFARILQLKDHGYSNVEIAKRMGYSNESTVRSKLKIAEEGRLNEIDTIANTIKKSVDEKGYIDIGTGVNLEIGVNENKFKTAVTKLIEEGHYERYYTNVTQLGTGKQTTLMVLCPPGTTYPQFKNDISDDMTKIKSITDYMEYDKDGKLVSRAPKYPAPFSSERLAVRYGDEGGKEKDGVIELRRGVNDISLGGLNYAQVRINVDGTHYLKGMAMYSDDLPKGVDILFNTNKPSGTPILGDGKENSVLKKLKDDPKNPFGATIKSEEISARSQRMYLDPETGEMKQSVINIVNEQGDWQKWSKSLSSQFLSKQPLETAQKQLNLDVANRRDEFEEIKSITNPTIKKYYLDNFAEECEKAASDLKAAAFPRQSAKVILPVKSLKDNEVYAPTYNDGEEVALVRYPHQGTFEIPILKVNNKNKEAISVIGPLSQDAIGINAKVAERLSGADFDGDSVTVIPTKNIKIKSTEPLEALKNFDYKEKYRGYEGMQVMKEKTKQTQMGIISNLVTDMTLKGADPDEIARATKHAMVVIDAPKHELDYRKSYEENRIAELKAKYQRDEATGKIGGVSTLISRAGSKERVPEIKSYFNIDPETGEKIIENTGRTYLKEVEKYVPAKVRKAKEKAGLPITKEDYIYKDKKGSFEKDFFDYKTGEVITKRVYTEIPVTEVTRMSRVKDANELSTGLPMEKLYAKYANEMKSMGNEARKLSYETKNNKVNKSAASVYSKEIEDLNSKILRAQKNAPRERQATVIATQIVNEQINTNPEIKDSKDKLKKIRNSALMYGRSSVGASKKDVEVSITPKEWEAINSNAVGSTTLKTLLNNCNKDQLRDYAMPKTGNTISPAKVNKIKAMAASGHTISDICDAIGISQGQVSNVLYGDD